MLQQAYGHEYRVDQQQKKAPSGAFNVDVLFVCVLGFDLIAKQAMYVNSSSPCCVTHNYGLTIYTLY